MIRRMRYGPSSHGCATTTEAVRRAIHLDVRRPAPSALADAVERIPLAHRFGELRKFRSRGFGVGFAKAYDGQRACEIPAAATRSPAEVEEFIQTVGYALRLCLRKPSRIFAASI